MPRHCLALSLALILLVAAPRGFAGGPDEGDQGAGMAIAGDTATEEMVPIAEDINLQPESEPPLPVAFAIRFPMDEPAWYFRADGMAMKREGSDRVFAKWGHGEWREVENPAYEEAPDLEEGEEDPRLNSQRHPYIWEGSITFTDALSSGDTNIDRFQGGGQILVGRTLGRNTGFEVSYFGLANWTGTAVITDNSPLVWSTENSPFSDGQEGVDAEITFPGRLFSPLSRFGDRLFRTRTEGVESPLDVEDIAFDGNNLVRISYSSGLDNLEWNIRHWIVRVPGYTQISLVLGGRYMNVDECFDYYTSRNDAADAPDDFNVSAAKTTITTNTHNPLLGAQVGGTYEVCVSRGCWFDCELKGAVFSNSARQSTLFLHTGGDMYDVGPRLGQARRSGIASAIDATFTTRFSIGPRAAVHLGYQVLYVSGLALAPENLSADPDVLLNGPATVVTNGDLLYHGLNLGLTCVW